MFFLAISTLDQKLDKKFLDFVHPDDMEATLDAMSQLSRQEQVLNFTNRYLSKDGSYRYIEWSSHPYAAARDVTNRVISHNAIEERERNFRSFLKL